MDRGGGMIGGERTYTPRKPLLGVPCGGIDQATLPRLQVLCVYMQHICTIHKMHGCHTRCFATHTRW